MPFQQICACLYCGLGTINYRNCYSRKQNLLRALRETQEGKEDSDHVHLGTLGVVSIKEVDCQLGLEKQREFLDIEMERRTAHI